MKRAIIVIFIATFLAFPAVTYAQTAVNQDVLRNQIIAILVQMIEELQRQIAEIQAKEAQVLMTAPAIEPVGSCFGRGACGI